MTGDPRARRWLSTVSHVDLTRPRGAVTAVSVEATPQSFTFDLAATAVIVVDMQNDFGHPEGWLGGIGVDVSGVAELVPALEHLLHRVRAENVPVIWLNWGNRPDLVNVPPNVVHVYDGAGTGGGLADRAGRSESVLVEGSWGASIIDGLTVAPADLHVPKYRMSGFWDTVLDSTLRSLGVDHLLFAGVNVDQCVLATLIDAACAGYDCVLVSDVSGTTSPEYCTQATHYNVRQCFGLVVGSAPLITGIDAATRSPEESLP